MKKVFIFLIVIILILAAGYFLFFQDKGEEFSKAEVKQPLSSFLSDKGIMAVMKTNFGEIKLELFASEAPKTVENFVKLSNQGFYNGTKFHRVINRFMIQGGDPLSKDDSLKNKWGTGGPGYVFEDEIHSNNYNIIGAISMANAGPNTNGSQFFINTSNNNFLNTKHTVFGKVIEGMDVVRQIENTATDELDRPIDNVIIESIEIISNSE